MRYRFHLSVLAYLLTLCTASATELGAALDLATHHRFPICASVVDVTKAPYLAKGDGISDDSDALNRAIYENVGANRIIYLPKGIYLVSRSLNWEKKQADGKDAWGFTWIQGESPATTRLRLKPGTFTDPAHPQALMNCRTFGGSADWFHNFVQDLAIEIGAGNPGAIALQFYSNNTGGVSNLHLSAAEGSGAIGLDLGEQNLDGPLLVQDLLVEGFATGVRLAGGVNSQTCERLTLRHQREVAIDDRGQPLTIRSLLVEGIALPLRAEGTVCLVDASFVGSGAAKQLPAIERSAKGTLFVRNMNAVGYRSAVAVAGGKEKDKELPGPKLAEWCSARACSPFASPPGSLGLPVASAPSIPWDDPKDWALAETFGADPKGSDDSSAALQRAMDSGKTTVFMPGCYNLRSPVRIPASVRRIIGTGGWISVYGQKNDNQTDFVVTGDGPGPLLIEHFALIKGLTTEGKRPLHIRHLELHPSGKLSFAPGGTCFLDDVAMSAAEFSHARIWARQLNVENEGRHVLNDGGALWVLGYKTERGGTLLETDAGGQSEILGTFSYTTTAGKLAPMFINRDSAVWAFFNEVCFNGDPFATLISETRAGETRTLVGGGGGHTSPYSGRLP